MKNSFATLHRNLDTRIKELEKELHPNQRLIKDLKKRKLKLKDDMDSIVNDMAKISDKRKAKKHANRLMSALKEEGKKTRKRVKRRKAYSIKRNDIHSSG